MMPRPSVAHKVNFFNPRSIRFLSFGAEVGRGGEGRIERTDVLGSMESHASSLSGEGGCLNLGSLVKVFVMGPGGSR